MAMHVFPLKLHPKFMFAVFSAIASRSSQVSPKSGALETFLCNSARLRGDGERIRRRQLRQVTLLRSSVAFSGSGESYRKETFTNCPHSAQDDQTSEISRRALFTRCMVLLIQSLILPPPTTTLCG